MPKTITINPYKGYIISLALLIASLPLSRFTLSLFQVILVFFWFWIIISEQKEKSTNAIKLIANTFGEKVVEFYRNKPAFVFALLYLMHIVGVFYSNDLSYAMKDLRIKLPILFLPFIISTGPKLNSKQLQQVLLVYVLAIVCGVIYHLILYQQAGEANVYAINPHISHIRFSLNAAFVIFICIYYCFSKDAIKSNWRYALLIPVICIPPFLLYYSYKTGVIMIPIALFATGIFIMLFSKNRLAKYSMLFLNLALVIGLVVFIKYAQKIGQEPDVDFSKLDKYTANGNVYTHDTTLYKFLDERWVGLYICDSELENAWKQRSSKDILGIDANKNFLKGTVIKYMASKELRKDSVGVMSLTDEDIQNIENGICNANFKEPKTVKTHIEEFYNAYRTYVKTKDANYSSFWQRVEYWRASLFIIKDNFWTGVGTGDLPQSFEKQYVKMDTKLFEDLRHRSHNQYFAITIGFGIFGLLFFLFVLIYPGFKTKSYNFYIYFIFWVILMTSMLVEDTIESQEGVSFFIIFSSLLLFGRKTQTEA